MNAQEMINALKGDKNYIAIKKTEDKEAYDTYLKKLQDKFLKRTYVPYAEKTLWAEKIVNATSYTEVEGKKLIKMNTAQRSYLFLLTLISLYTKLDVDFENGLELFDQIQQDEVLDFVTELIPDSEFKIMNGLLDMAVDDFMTNNMNVVTFLDTKIAALDISGKAILYVLQQMAPEEVANATKNLQENV